jgi:peptidoglycan/xylan/chitin deacetylase (PgdA/CDA1 family)
MMRWSFQRLAPGGDRGRLSILIFHRILPAPDALLPDELDAARFNDVCVWLRRWFNVLPLDEAVRQLAEGRLAARALSITFDDGYADNHDIALPILMRHGLRATFFVATGFLDGGRMFNDTVIEAVRRTPLAELDLRGMLAADLNDSYSVAETAAKRDTIGTVIRAVKYLPQAQRDAAVAEIAVRARAPLTNDLMMRSEQVVNLHRSGMQIGAHTVSHPILARLAPDEARKEMAEGRHTLRSLTGAHVGLFAYPNGRPGQDYGPVHAAIARELGFDAAVSTAPGAADVHCDRFQLPRFTPWDRSKLRFGVRMLANYWTPYHVAPT